MTLEDVKTTPVILPKVSRPKICALNVDMTAYKKARKIVNAAKVPICQFKSGIMAKPENARPISVVRVNDPTKPKLLMLLSINGTHTIPAGNTNENTFE